MSVSLGLYFMLLRCYVIETQTIATVYFAMQIFESDINLLYFIRLGIVLSEMLANQHERLVWFWKAGTTLLSSRISRNIHSFSTVSSNKWYLHLRWTVAINMNRPCHENRDVNNWFEFDSFGLRVHSTNNRSVCDSMYCKTPKIYQQNVMIEIQNFKYKLIIQLKSSETRHTRNEARIPLIT